MHVHGVVCDDMLLFRVCVRLQGSQWVCVLIACMLEHVLLLCAPACHVRAGTHYACPLPGCMHGMPVIVMLACHVMCMQRSPTEACDAHRVWVTAKRVGATQRAGASSSSCTGARWTDT